MKDFFAGNLTHLREKRGLSQAGMLDALGFKRTTWNSYEQGKSYPSFNDLLTISRYFGVGLSDLVERDLTKGKLMPMVAEEENSQYGKVNGKGKGNLTGRQEAKNELRTIQFAPKVITVDNSGRENILYVPVTARLGYRNGGYRDADYLSKLQSFSFPGLRNGTFRMFETEGVSMAPTVGPGMLIGQFVESIDDIKDNRVYAVVLTDGFVVKRLLNRVSQRGKLVLKSDTIAHRLEYPTEEIDYEKVLEVWEAKIKISADFQQPSAIYEQIAALESDMVAQQQINQNLEGQISELRDLITLRLNS